MKREVLFCCVLVVLAPALVACEPGELEGPAPGY